MTKKRVVVTGIGIISNNGCGLEEFWTSIVNGNTGIKECSLFDASKIRTKQVGEIAKKEIPYMVDEVEKEGRIHHLMKYAIDEMFADGSIDAKYLQKMKERVGLSLATSLAANNNIMRYVHEKKNGKDNGEWLATIPDFVEWLKNYCHIEGKSYTTMAACASGTTAIGIAYDQIQNDKADIVIAGGADPLTYFSCAGFHALKSLSNSVGKPFDKNRDGINIGEASAFFIVEELQHALDRNAKIYGEILGYGINNDAYHVTSPSPDGCGASASIDMAMAHTNITYDDVDYINAHGTGTHLNDEMETKVIKNKFEGKDLNVSSTKSVTGHCMAAAGAVEFAVVLMAIKNGIVPPSANLTDKMDECMDNVYNTKAIERPVKYALSNSFAFAGNTSSILVGGYC